MNCAGGEVGSTFQVGDARQCQGVGRIVWGWVSHGHVGRDGERLGRHEGERRWNVMEGLEILG